MKKKQKKNSSRIDATYPNNEIDEIRKKQLLESNKEEDKTIRRLEKHLKIDKKKKKKSSGFLGDGLDYLLEVIDNKDNNRIFTDDSEDEFVAVEKSKVTLPSKRKSTEESDAQPECKKRTLTNLLRENEGHVSDSEESEPPYGGDDDDFSESEGESVRSEDKQNHESENDEKKCEDAKNEKEKPKIWEDIYGRFRDEHGNVVKTPSVQKYVPPSLQKTVPDNQKQEELMKIKKKLQGLLNKLNESYLQPISHQVEEMYMKHGRNDINESLFSSVYLILTSDFTTPCVIMRQAMLIALLHANVGAEIGAYFLQHLVEKLDNLFNTDNYGEGKMCNNVLTFLSHLYNFKVAHSTLICDIFHKLIDSFKSKDIKLIELFLKNIGFVLRKDDPVSLKEIILSIQAKASTVNDEQNDSRVKQMLQTLTTIRNNNIYKITDYDPSIIEHSKKVLKAYVRKGCHLQELAVSYEDLIKADEKGRWWIVGSAWSEREDQSTSKKTQSSVSLPKTQYSEKLLQLAQKHHMNTDVRKAIFCIIMSAEDYMDAFQKLLKLNLKHQQKREIINIILHCAMKEKTYNPYYAYLGSKFCNFSREFRMSLQFSLWDKFKELGKMKPSELKNLANFLSHCFTSLVLPLSVLKVLSFVEMDKTMHKFLHHILLTILLHESEETCIQVFKKIAVGDLNVLRQSLHHFMRLFLLKDLEKYTPEVAEKLTERIKAAEAALFSAKNALQL